MAKNIIESPMNNVANPPAGYKGSSGTYNGVTQGPFGGHKRTPSSDAVPEKTFDEAMPSGDKTVITPNQLPKNL